MTTRTVQSSRSGPVTLRADLSAITLHVITEARPYGEVTVHTDDNTGPSADAVNAASLDASGDELRVSLDHAPGGVTLIQSGRGGGSYISVAGSQNIVVGNRVTMVNGRIVSGSGMYMSAGSAIVVEARLPHGSNVVASSQSGNLDLNGVFDQVDARSQSGDVDIHTVREVRASTKSGDVTVQALTGYGDLNSMSGDVVVRGPAGAQASARTLSGDVRYSGGIRVAGSSMSGRVLGR